jgi:hypothetical protein
MPLWNLCLSSNVFWVVQHTTSFQRCMNPYSQIWLSKSWRFHGRLLCLWKDIWWMSEKIRQSLAVVPWKGSNSKLGEVPFQGARGYSFGALSVLMRNWGGSSQNRSHRKSPTTYQCKGGSWFPKPHEVLSSFYQRFLSNC